MSAIPQNPQAQPEAKPKRPFWKKKRFIIPAALLLLIIIISSLSRGGGDPQPAAQETATTSPAAPPTTEAPAAPSEAGIGTPVSVDFGGGNAAKITIVGATYGTAGVSQFAGAPDNGGYLVLDVLWEAEKGTTNVNPLYFTAKSAEGRAGEPALGAEGQLGSGEVPAGDKMRGNVAIDVGPGPWTVTVTGTLLSEAARWTIPAQ